MFDLMKYLASDLINQNWKKLMYLALSMLIESLLNLVISKNVGNNPCVKFLKLCISVLEGILNIFILEAKGSIIGV